MLQSRKTTNKCIFTVKWDDFIQNLFCIFTGSKNMYRRLSIAPKTVPTWRTTWPKTRWTTPAPECWLSSFSSSFQRISHSEGLNQVRLLRKKNKYFSRGLKLKSISTRFIISYHKLNRGSQFQKKTSPWTLKFDERKGYTVTDYIFCYVSVKKLFKIVSQNTYTGFSSLFAGVTFSKFPRITRVHCVDNFHWFLWQFSPKSENALWKSRG